MCGQCWGQGPGRQCEGWTTLAHSFRGLQFIGEFSAVGVWPSRSCGKAPGSREGASKGGASFKQKGRLHIPWVPQPSRQHQQLGTTVHSEASCAGPGMADRPCLSCSDELPGLAHVSLLPEAVLPLSACPLRSNTAVV